MKPVTLPLETTYDALFGARLVFPVVDESGAPVDVSNLIAVFGVDTPTPLRMDCGANDQGVWTVEIPAAVLPTLADREWTLRVGSLDGDVSTWARGPVSVTYGAAAGGNLDKSTKMQRVKVTILEREPGETEVLGVEVTRGRRGKRGYPADMTEVGALIAAYLAENPPADGLASGDPFVGGTGATESDPVLLLRAVVLDEGTEPTFESGIVHTGGKNGVPDLYTREVIVGIPAVTGGGGLPLSGGQIQYAGAGQVGGVYVFEDVDDDGNPVRVIDVAIPGAAPSAGGAVNPSATFKEGGANALARYAASDVLAGPNMFGRLYQRHRVFWVGNQYGAGPGAPSFAPGGGGATDSLLLIPPDAWFRVSAQVLCTDNAGYGLHSGRLEFTARRQGTGNVEILHQVMTWDTASVGFNVVPTPGFYGSDRSVLLLTTQPGDGAGRCWYIAGDVIEVKG